MRRELPMEAILRDYNLGNSFTALGQTYRCCPKILKSRISEHLGAPAESDWTRARARNLRREQLARMNLIVLVRARLMGASLKHLAASEGLTVLSTRRLLREAAERAVFISLAATARLEGDSLKRISEKRALPLEYISALLREDARQVKLRY